LTLKQTLSGLSPSLSLNSLGSGLCDFLIFRPLSILSVFLLLRSFASSKQSQRDSSFLAFNGRDLPSLSLLGRVSCRAFSREVRGLDPPPPPIQDSLSFIIIRFDSLLCFPPLFGVREPRTPLGCRPSRMPATPVFLPFFFLGFSIERAELVFNLPFFFSFFGAMRVSDSALVNVCPSDPHFPDHSCLPKIL